ncbi:MAG: transcriptional repressor LexA [Herbaspirillum sp.]
MEDQKYLDALRTYWKRHQSLPSYAKLCDVVGLASKSGVFEMVGRLVDAGFIERIESRLAPTRRFSASPVVGHVRAGLPQPASDDEFEVLAIDDYLVGDPNRTILCKVRGELMRDAGLLDGDLVVVERNSPTQPGDVVVAVVDGELTVKILRMARGQYYLEPANPQFEPIHPKGSLEILGVVVGSFRRLRR